MNKQIEKISRQDVVKVVAKKTGYRQNDVRAVVDELLNTITDVIEKGGWVKLTGFGTFKTSPRKGGKRYVGVAKKIIDIPDTNVVRFVPSSKVKERVNA